MTDVAPLSPPAACFYEPLGDERYRATAATGGPWDPTAQHGGPPAALLGRAVERTLSSRADVAAMVVVRATCEILGPIPVGEVAIASRLARPGRSVELVEATLTADGRVAARMHVWRVAPSPEDVPVSDRPGPPWPLPERASGIPRGDWHDGYLSAIEWRFVEGHFDRPGPAIAWTRARAPLVAGEELTPLQRTLLVADSGNGISSELAMGGWWYINPRLTVHLHRPAEGEWLAVEARTTIASGGAGLAESVLHDRRGPIGRGAQALYVARRA